MRNEVELSLALITCIFYSFDFLLFDDFKTKFATSLCMLSCFDKFFVFINIILFISLIHINLQFISCIFDI